MRNKIEEAAKHLNWKETRRSSITRRLPGKKFSPEELVDTLKNLGIDLTDKNKIRAALNPLGINNKEKEDLWKHLGI